LKILLLTSEWPDEENPNAVPFLVQQVRFIQEAGVEVEVFHFRGHRNLLNYLKAWKNVRHMPFWKEADILHAHWGQSAFLAIFSRKKLLITFHGSDLWGIVNSQGKYTFEGKILSRFSRLMAKKADCCIVVSKHLKEFLPQSTKKVVTIPMGVDLNKFYLMDKLECRTKLNLENCSQIILFVSNPDRPEKRFFLAQQAYQLYKIKHPEEIVELLVVNNVDHSQVPYYLNAGDVLILSSAYEGAPTIVKEALACKTPIVSFNVGDVSDRIKDIQGCYLCEEQTVECLVKGLEVALAHGKLSEMPAASIYDLDERKSVVKIKQIYSELIENTL
jgi:glycosyltransferase involved in cell wall biosynthesis